MSSDDKNAIKHFTGSLKKSIIIKILILIILPLLIVSISSYNIAYNALHKNAENTLSRVSILKNKYIQAYFEGIFTILDYQAKLSSNLDMLKRVKDDFEKSSGDLDIYRKRYYNDKQNDRYQIEINKLMNSYGFYDGFLIDEKGNVLYSNKKEEDFCTNLFTGKYSNTKFAKKCRKAISNGKAYLSDLEFYAPSNNELALFAIKPLFDKNDKKIGLIAFQIPMGNVNKIVNYHSTSTQSIENYIIGEDLLMRSELGTDKNSALNIKIDNEICNEWQNVHNAQSKDLGSLNHAMQIRHYKNYNEVKVVGVLKDLAVLNDYGLDWAMITEIKESEAYGAVIYLRNLVIIVTSLTIIISIIILFFIAKSIANPIKKLSLWAKGIAVGNLDMVDVDFQNNEIGEMAESFREVVQNFKQIEDTSKIIAEGNYDVKVNVKSDKDILSLSINKMTKILSENYFKNIDLIQKTEQLELSSKYKSEFLANMSHELRTPLNIIIVLSQLLTENMTNNLNEKQLEFAKTIYSSGADLLTLINDILDISKIESGKMKFVTEVVDSKVLAKKVERMFLSIANKKGLEFKINVAEELTKHKFYSDGQRIRQVIINLLSNSFKFTEKGSIIIDMDYIKKDDFVNDKAVLIRVKDTGIGIPKDKQNLIFESFKQADGSTSRKYGGTGLGLTITRSIITALGGNIMVESEDGKGTVFNIVLPLNFEKYKDKIKEKEIIKTSTCLDSQVKLKEKVSDNEVKNTGVKNEVELENNKNHIEETKEFIWDDRRDMNDGDKLILIINSDISMSKKLYELSKNKDFKCIVVENGREGIHFADYYSPNAIILGENTKDIDWKDVVRGFQKNNKTVDIPVHIISIGNIEENDCEIENIIGYITDLSDKSQIERIFLEIKKDTSNKLLIVEDNDTLRLALKEMFVYNGIDVVSVSDGKSAIALLKEHKLGGMILDLGLSDMNGLDILKSLRKEDIAQSMPVIIYTGQNISQKDEMILKKFSKSIIIKGAKSSGRLLEETKLFLTKISDDSSMKSKKYTNKIIKTIELNENILDENESNIFKGKNVLVIDDDMRNVFALNSLLESRGMIASSAVNINEGIKKIENGDFDCILMDIMMPEMDGYEAISIIRKNKAFKDLPIIALTAKAMKNDKEKCIQVGASDYLSKPIDADKLFSLMKVWLYD